MVDRIMNFIGKFMYAKKLAYLLTVVCANYCLIASVHLQKEITNQWVAALTALGVIVAGGYLGGKYLMRDKA